MRPFPSLMNIGSTFAAPPYVSPCQTALPHHAGSLLNPFGFLRASAQPLKISAMATTISTKTHLANLELLLQRPYYPPPLPTPNPGKDPDPPNSSTFNGGNLLRALNLPFLFPTSCKQLNELSPRSLTSLHRLLSDSPRPSPHAHIASHWRHYHGGTDWAGLLDPLDENLHCELVCCGNLIQASYHAFHSRPAASVDVPCHIALLDCSYHVTRSVFATSFVEIPCYLDRLVAPG